MNAPTVNPIYRSRKFKHRIGMALSFLAMSIGLLFLLWILATLLIKGAGALHWSMFTQTTPAPGSSGGGLLNPIIGSLLLVGTATLISTPVGILARRHNRNRAHHDPQCTFEGCRLHIVRNGKILS